jgi:hypothetical protein
MLGNSLLVDVQHYLFFSFLNMNKPYFVGDNTNKGGVGR